LVRHRSALCHLKQVSFRFVVLTTCYALMQPAGLVDDHLIGCLRHGAASA